MFIYVGGVPAVGKTSIIEEAKKIAERQKIRLERVTGTAIMCELAEVATIAELRRLPEKTRKKLRPEMNRRLYDIDRMDPSVIRVCDGHFCYFDINGVKYGKRQIQPWDNEQLAGFILILSSPRLILERRLNEKHKRPDRQLGLDFIKKEQYFEIQIAREQAQHLYLPIGYIVNNDIGNISEKAEEMLFFIKKWTAT